LAQEGWEGNGTKDADDHYDDKQFDQRETSLQFVALFRCLKALE